MQIDEPVLCYVEGCWAYFTTQNLSEQWGDDWNDAPYEHNAGEPYQYSTHDEKKGIKPWKIIKLAFITGLEQPDAWELNSGYSVEQINNCAVPWLQSGRYGPRSPHTDHPIQIWAGTPMSEVIRLIHLGKGEVYLSEAASR